MAATSERILGPAGLEVVSLFSLSIVALVGEVGDYYG